MLDVVSACDQWDGGHQGKTAADVAQNNEIKNLIEVRTMRAGGGEVGAVGVGGGMY